MLLFYQITTHRLKHLCNCQKCKSTHLCSQSTVYPRQVAQSNNQSTSDHQFTNNHRLQTHHCNLCYNHSDLQLENPDCYWLPQHFLLIHTYFGVVPHRLQQHNDVLKSEVLSENIDLIPVWFQNL